ncbi:hypothetical protein GCM10011575_11720 [Microlunatus endophyticus]|uniref:Aminoglycoside phosphotransferase domain-containing protein n=1 Tax=Microlunatus endophyticus TaxID=1716077 RepID=A0A917S4J5_9ACTN|nr:aminoglycoside phosphotransferase family protein [Microlunatus endophyticus]GGL54988.1 hypothetical protein GCM10011575_11720 [Microlunatus endophyticus]
MPYEPMSDQALNWVLEQWARPRFGDGAIIESVERLVGGITAAMDRIVARSADGGRHRAVLRRWIGHRVHVEDHLDAETGALQALAGHRIGAPELISVDRSGRLAGVPSVLMTEVGGRVELAPADLDSWVRRLARVQASIHELPPTLAGAREGWFDPGVDLGWITDTGLRRAALQAADGPMDGQRVFVHGDYQHFNVLWTDGRVTGVVDWTMAGVGPRGIDVGHCMLNLAGLFSAATAENYLQCYQRAAGVRVDPRAVLRALLIWSPEWLDFIPVQVAGRAAVDLAGMSGRVAEAVRRTLLSF